MHILFQTLYVCSALNSNTDLEESEHEILKVNSVARFRKPLALYIKSVTFKLFLSHIKRRNVFLS